IRTTSRGCRRKRKNIRVKRKNIRLESARISPSHGFQADEADVARLQGLGSGRLLLLLLAPSTKSTHKFLAHVWTRDFFTVPVRELRLDHLAQLRSGEIFRQAPHVAAANIASRFPDRLHLRSHPL